MPLTTYRNASRADIPLLVDFQIAMARETEQLALDRVVCTQGVAAVFDEPSLGQYYVAEVQGQVVCSTLITYEWSDWRNGVVWWIQSVYVIPGARQSGIFAGLYSHIRNLAQTRRDVRGIRLYVDRRNTIAQQVYRRLGMDGEHYRVFEWMKSPS